MMRAVVALLTILLTVSSALAQIPLPQNVPGPVVPNGLDALGRFTSRQLNFTDLNFGTIYGQQAISTSQNTAQWGSAVYVLDSDPGYQVNTALQGQCLDDLESFVIGFVTALDNSSGSTVFTLDVVIAQGGSPCSNWFFQVINGVTNGVPPTQAIALSTSSFAMPVAGTTQSLTVDANKGYSAGSLIFISALGNSSAWFWAIVENYNSTSGALNCFVVQSSQATASSPGIFMTLGPGALRLSGSAKSYANWAVGMSSTLAPFVPILGFSGTSLTYGSSAGQIKQGGVVTVTTQTGLLLNNSHIVVSSSTDSTQYFRGIGQYNSSTGSLTIYITDASGSGTFASWSLFAQDGPPVNADQIAVSTSSATLGSGDFTFTIQSGQNFPIQGPVTLTALANPLNQMLGVIKAYSGTSLIVTVSASGVYGSGTFTAWSILNTGPAQTRISLYQMNDLQLGGVGTTTLTIAAGSIRSSDDSTDLVLSSPVTISTASGSTSFVGVTGPGTVSASGSTSIVGTSTTFTTTFAFGIPGSANGSLTDLNNQLTALGLSTLSEPSVFTSGGNSSTVDTVTNNTSMAMFDNMTITGGSSYTRGGIGNVIVDELVYGVGLAYTTATGAIVPFLTSFTLSGTPDLPSGTSKYRIIGYVVIIGSNKIGMVAQPLATNVLTTSGDLPYEGTYTASPSLNTYPTYLTRLPVGNAGAFLGVSSGQPKWLTNSLVPTGIFSATITPTALGINESSCNTTTGLVTMASSFGGTLAAGMSVVLTGTVSTGYTTGTAYYINVPGGSNNSFTTWTNYTDAVNGSGASQVKCSANNNSGWSLRYFAYTNVFNVGFSTTAPIGATPGTTTMELDFNLTNALASTVGNYNATYVNLVDTGAVTRNLWLTLYDDVTFSSTSLVQTGAHIGESLASTLQGTWAQQGTTAFKVQVWIWGALDEPIPANDNDLIERAVA